MNLGVLILAIGLPITVYAQYNWRSPFWCYMMGPRFITFDNSQLMTKNLCPSDAVKPCAVQALADTCLPEDFSIRIIKWGTYEEIFGYDYDGEMVIQTFLVTYNGHEIEYGFGQVKVDGEAVNFPYSGDGFQLTGSNPEGFSPRQKFLEFCDGTTFIVNTCYYFFPSDELIEALKDNNCGICGYGNGIRGGDIRTLDGSFLAYNSNVWPSISEENTTKFFSSWARNKGGRLTGNVKCPTNGKKHSKCPPGQVKLAETKCSALLDDKMASCREHRYFKWWYSHHYDKCVDVACHQTGKAKINAAACLKMREVADQCQRWADGYYPMTNLDTSVVYDEC